MRKTFNETVAVLREAGVVYGDQNPRLPDAMPQYDDELRSGFSIFRTMLENKDFSNLDMRRTFVEKSELAHCDFSNSGLAESNLCWNDFIQVNFSEADLSGSDLRASIYDRVDFTRADLGNTDLRHCSFTRCTFTSANMRGAKLCKDDAERLPLSEQQRQAIDWQESPGEEPDGG